MSHMTVYRITDDGRDGRSGDIMNHCRFIKDPEFGGDAESDDLFWDGQAGVASLDGDGHEIDEDDLLDAEEVERGLQSRHHLNGGCKRGHEGFDQQVHFWPGSKSRTARDIIM